VTVASRWLIDLAFAASSGRELHPLKTSAFHGALLRQLSLFYSDPPCYDYALTRVLCLRLTLERDRRGVCFADFTGFKEGASDEESSWKSVIDPISSVRNDRR
jgi:hypothetical protein